LLASVSHDLRTPLTSIRAAVDSLLAEGADWGKDALHEFHQIINEEVQRLTNLVQNLLQMARIEAGELHPQKEWTAVAELIANVEDRCSNSLQNHIVSVAVDEKLPLVKLDSLLVAQALSHLVENAAKYSRAGSKITICGIVKQHRLIISVEDEGVGIAHDDLAHIFDKFYRSSTKQVRERSGTGMGLSIARGIIEAHGGEISVESAIGGGATFQFSIPVEVKEQSLEYHL
jgi:two-component system sensor histidine kinase KdpD